MKKYISLSFIIGVAMIFSSCKREGDNIFNMFTDVKVEFHNNDPHDVVETSTKVIKAGDEIWIDYTITSPNSDMYVVNLLEVGNSTPIQKYTCTTSERNTVSGIFKVTPSRTGDIGYRVYATDKTGIYLGDGYKTLGVNVTNDFVFTTERLVTVPNNTFRIDTNKANLPATTITYLDGNPKLASFYSLSEAKAYTYEEAAVNSNKIDCGIYVKLVMTYTPDGSDKTNTAKGKLDFVLHYYLYATGVTPSPLPFTNFPFTGWTSKGTLFSLAPSGSLATFNTGTKTGLQLGTAAAKATINLTNLEVLPANAYYFKTKEGKYGMLSIPNIGSDRLRALSLNFYEKIQL